MGYDNDTIQNTSQGGRVASAKPSHLPPQINASNNSVDSVNNGAGPHPRNSKGNSDCRTANHGQHSGQHGQQDRDNRVNKPVSESGSANESSGADQRRSLYNQVRAQIQKWGAFDPDAENKTEQQSAVSFDMRDQADSYAAEGIAYINATYFSALFYLTSLPCCLA